MLLLEGSAPTAVFGLVCLASLWTSRPLMFRLALGFTGADTPRGRDFAARWRYPGFLHAFRVLIVVWGVAYLAEALARVILVETTTTATALTASKVMPYAAAAILVGWTIAYGQRAKRRGERLAATAQAGAQRAGSRSRAKSPGNRDNYRFARWPAGAGGPSQRTTYSRYRAIVTSIILAVIRMLCTSQRCYIEAIRATDHFGTPP